MSAGPGRRRLLVATRSAHKLRELRELLDLRRTDLVSLDDLGVPGDPVEDGATFETNAAIKARFGARATGLPTLADDSGIEVDALDGGPGVRTRRYAGEDATDDENNAQAARRRSRGLPPERRGARYVCVLAARPARRRPGPRGGLPLVATRGTCRGRIATRAARDRRVRLRPDLRAGVGAARRPDARAVDARPRSTRSRTGRGPPAGWRRSCATLGF